MSNVSLEAGFVPQSSDCTELMEMVRQDTGVARSGQRTAALALLGYPIIGLLSAGAASVAANFLGIQDQVWLFVGFFAVGLILYRVAVRRWTLERVADQVERAFPGRVTHVLIDDTGLTVTDEHARSSIRWAGIERVYLSSQSLGFRVGSSVIAVPRRAFMSESSLAEFAAFSIGKIPSEAQRASLTSTSLAELVDGRR